MPRIATALLVVSVLLLGVGDARADALEREDEDLRVTDTWFGLHLGSNIATAGFGTGAVIAGIHNFALIGEGNPAPTQTFFLGLTLTSLGVASIISSATGAEANVRSWQALRAGFEGASEPERRLLREMEAARLRRLAINRAIGLAADGTFLGIGIALTLGNSTGLGVPLILNGAFILGLDIFKLIVDDQTARSWEERSVDADAGYFTRRRIRPKVRAFGAMPLIARGPDGRVTTGTALAIAGTF